MCGGEVGGAELRPRLGDGRRAGNELLIREHEMLMHVAAVAVVGLDRGNPLGLRPGLGRADRGRDAVCRLDVGHAEHVFRIRHRLVEKEVGATVVEHRQHAELLGDRTERRRVAAGDDAGKQVDLLGELHAAKLFDVGVGTRRLVGKDGLDLALAQESTFGVDFLGREHVPLPPGFAQQIGGAGQERDVAGLEWPVRDVAFRLGRRMRWPRSGEVGGRHHSASQLQPHRWRNFVQECPAVDWVFHQFTSLGISSCPVILIDGGRSCGLLAAILALRSISSHPPTPTGPSAGSELLSRGPASFPSQVRRDAIRTRKNTLTLKPGL